MKDPTPINRIERCPPGIERIIGDALNKSRSQGGRDPTKSHVAENVRQDAPDVNHAAMRMVAADVRRFLHRRSFALVGP